MKFSLLKFFRLPFQLILLGVLLGYSARWLLGPPEQPPIPRAFTHPVTEPEEEEFTDLPLIR